MEELISQGFAIIENDGSIISSHKHGKIAFICPKCMSYTYANVHNNIFVSGDTEIDVLPQYTVKCKSCGNTFTTTDEIDGNIAPIISKLNKNGIKTKYSCEGHYLDYPESEAYIVFADKKLIRRLVYKFPLPKTWELQEDEWSSGIYDVGHMKDIEGLSKWVDLVCEQQNK